MSSSRSTTDGLLSMRSIRLGEPVAGRRERRRRSSRASSAVEIEAHAARDDEAAQEAVAGEPLVQLLQRSFMRSPAEVP